MFALHHSVCNAILVLAKSQSEHSFVVSNRVGSSGRNTPDRLGRQTPEHLGRRTPDYHSSGRQTPDHMSGRRTPEPQFRNPRVGALFNKWRNVWLMAMERQRRLQDALDNLNEVSVLLRQVALNSCSSEKNTHQSWVQRYSCTVNTTPYHLCLVIQ